jgi:hypothetical protein
VRRHLLAACAAHGGELSVVAVGATAATCTAGHGDGDVKLGAIGSVKLNVSHLQSRHSCGGRPDANSAPPCMQGNGLPVKDCD